MAVKVFVCYAHEDEQFLKELETHLKALMRQGFIDLWHDRNISAGTEWEKEIDKNLSSAHIILLLVSHYFMASDYCYSIEMKKALERHELGKARVIPIILRPVHWKEVLGKLQALPKDAKPVSSWQNQDDAFFNIVDGIRDAIKELLLEQGFIYSKDKRYPEALPDFKKAIQLDFNNALAYLGMADVLYALNELTQALNAYDMAININPNYASAWWGKGNVLYDLKDSEEAIIAFEQTIQLDQDEVRGYVGKGNSLRNLGRNREALTVYEQAIKLVPNNANLYNSKGEVLRELNRNEEALAAFEQASQIAPDNVGFNMNRIDISHSLRLSEAKVALRQVVERDIARRQVKYDIGERLIDQIWYTWTTTGYSNIHGFQVRAASQGLIDMKGQRINAIAPHLYYRLPQGIYDIDPQDAPITLALIETEHERILVNKVYRGHDEFGRPGVFFTHLLAGLPKEFSAREAIGMWKSPFWYTNDAALPPNELLLMTVSLEELLYSSQLMAIDITKVEKYLPFVIQAFLSLKQKQRIYIAAPSEIIAILVWGLTRSIPRGLLEGLTFSTYEYDVMQATELIIGTSFGREESNQKDLPAICYEEGLAINCYTGQISSKLDTSTLEASFALFATQSLVSNNMQKLNELSQKAEMMGVEDKRAFELLIKILVTD